MKTINQLFINGKGYICFLLKWTLLSLLVGIIGGVIGSLFHICIDWVTEYRAAHRWVICLLPVGGTAIAAMYGIFRKKGRLDTNRVFEAVKTEESVPLILTPLIFIGAAITHFFGGSAGREGAALQLGGSIGYNLGKLTRLNKRDVRIMVMAGMSAVFSALFGTPLTAAVFAMEVTCVGIMHYAALVPCVIAAIAATQTAQFFHISPVHFDTVFLPEVTTGVLLKTALLAVLCAIVSILFVLSIKGCEKYAKKWIPNAYLRGAAGGAAIILFTLIFGYDYNGAGMDIVGKALAGEAVFWAFLLKILFTAITISAGFKGGEIVPAFFVGSTFGCVAAGLIGLDPALGAAIGFVSVFCGAVNCPGASVFLAAEVFGTQTLLPMALACAVSFMMSGYFSLYSSQSFLFSKTEEKRLEP